MYTAKIKISVYFSKIKYEYQDDAFRSTNEIPPTGLGSQTILNDLQRPMLDVGQSGYISTFNNGVTDSDGNQSMFRDESFSSLPPINNNTTNAQLSQNQLQAGGSIFSAGGASTLKNNINGLQNATASLLIPDMIETPIKVIIMAISAIDLPGAHKFKKNSPVCSFACGRYTHSTEVWRTFLLSCSSYLEAFGSRRLQILDLLLIGKI
jgi:hypothetical protein